ncbi:Protein of unknown function (DUF3636) domain containing protein [Rhypophila sp. PSN 637]
MDDYSDDGFDDLNDNVLQELENDAIQLTQAQKLAQSQAPLPPPFLPQKSHQLDSRAQHHAQYQQQQQQPQPEVYDLDFDDDDLDDTVVIDELAPQTGPAIHKTLPPQPSRITPSLAGQQQRWNQQGQNSRSAYNPRPPYPQQLPARPAPPPLPSQRYSRPPVPPPAIPYRPSQAQQQPEFVRPPPPHGRPYPAQPSQAPHFSGAAQQNDIAAALQARLSALQAELTAARGEASILRSKYEKANTTHDAEIARLKKQNAEQLAKQERIVESALAAERTATTELEFARQDLKAGLGRAKSRKKDGTTTPKKSKSWGQPDGFDGVEILSSPSKGPAQKRRESGAVQGDRTPSKGKRKRPAVDSPSFALETHSDDVSVQEAAEPKKATAPRIVSDTLPFDFLRLVLDHSPLHGQPLTFDLFSRFVFPSQPQQSFASTIFQKLPEMGSPQEPLRLLVDFAELMIDMWQQCLSERYYGPIYYLAALVSYTLQLNAAAVAPHIIPTLVPVCSTTCRLIALPRFNSVDGNISDHPDSVVRQLLFDIDVTQSLSILYIAALGCLCPPPSRDDSDPDPHIALPLQFSPQTKFWRTMELEFVMKMLHPNQAEEDWFGMLSLLWTSVLPTSVGPIPNPTTLTTYFANGRSEPETPELVAFGIIDRLSSFLVEPPRWAATGTVKDLMVRLSVLKTLILFATSDFGVVHLARSDFAIPRFVTVLCWGVDRLYDVEVSCLSPPPGPATGRKSDDGQEKNGGAAESMDVDADKMQLDPPVQPVGENACGVANNSNEDDDEDEDENEETKFLRLLLRLISQAILLLHTLVTGPRTVDLANIAAKLAAFQGASQRYLITLARLNFAEEELVLERGIDAETVELAHELLELAMTPDEGEAVGELFGE